jgi:hypothetical protein
LRGERLDEAVGAEGRLDVCLAVEIIVDIIGEEREGDTKCLVN